MSESADNNYTVELPDGKGPFLRKGHAASLERTVYNYVYPDIPFYLCILTRIRSEINCSLPIHATIIVVPQERANIYGMFRTRNILHLKALKHPTVVGIEMM